MATIDLCAYPAGKSPDGRYNFVDPPILGPAVVGVGVALGVVSTSIAAGRLYIDRKQWHPAGCKIHASPQKLPSVLTE
jgi:hypothetical protein